MIQHRWLFSIVLLASSAAAAPKQYVLVRDDASLYIHPDERAAHARALDASHGFVDPQSGAVYGPAESVSGGIGAYQYVGVQGAFIEVESLPSAACNDHCVCPGWAVPGSLRFFVHRKDLALTTTREVMIGVPTARITLAAGVPIVTSAGKARALVDFFRLPIEVPADAVGDRYSPTRSFDRGWRPVAKTNGSLPFGLEPINPIAPTRLPIRKQQKIGDRVEVTVAFKCAELSFATTADHITGVGADSGPPGMLGILQERAPKAHFSARKGARAFWPDGAVAGRVEDGLDFDTPREASGRLCTDLHFAGLGTAKESLPICFDRRDVKSSSAKR